jgi:hypothetical protein
MFPKWKDWEEHSIFSLSMCKFMLSSNILFVFWYYAYDGLSRKLYLFEKLILIALVFIIYFFDKKKYFNRHQEFRSNWQELTNRKRLYLKIGAVLFFFTSWFIIFLTAWIFDRYK